MPPLLSKKFCLISHMVASFLCARIFDSSKNPRGRVSIQYLHAPSADTLSAFNTKHTKCENTRVFTKGNTHTHGTCLSGGTLAPPERVPVPLVVIFSFFSSSFPSSVFSLHFRCYPRCTALFRALAGRFLTSMYVRSFFKRLGPPQPTHGSFAATPSPLRCFSSHRVPYITVVTDLSLCPPLRPLSLTHFPSSLALALRFHMEVS